MATKTLHSLLENVLVEFRKLRCPLLNLRADEDFLQLHFVPKIQDVHYEWWLKKKLGELHVAVHFERKTESGAKKNLQNADQLSDKIKLIANAVGARSEVGFWNKNQTWTTAAIVFDVSESIPVTLPTKLASVMVLLVLVTHQDVKQMCDPATVER